jgi:hypothetical protein
LRHSESAGAGSSHHSLSRTAQDLKTAASSAERSIRELLAGVDHLRVIATALDNMDRIEEIQSERNILDDN